MIYKPLTNNSTPLIIEDIREYLKEDLPSQVTIDTGDLPHLIGEIERLNKENNDLRTLYQRTCNHLFKIGNDELARYFQAQINECNTFTPQGVDKE